MKNPYSPAFIAALARRFTRKFEIAEQVETPLPSGACREEFGDELRLWCRAHCTGGWRQTERSVRNAVVMEFESAADAAMFRDAAYAACRALIAARRSRAISLR